jgi:hypothetical protein
MRVEVVGSARLVECLTSECLISLAPLFQLYKTQSPLIKCSICVCKLATVQIRYRYIHMIYLNSHRRIYYLLVVCSLPRLLSPGWDSDPSINKIYDVWYFSLLDLKQVSPDVTCTCTCTYTYMYVYVYQYIYRFFFSIINSFSPAE